MKEIKGRIPGTHAELEHCLYVEITLENFIIHEYYVGYSEDYFVRSK